MFFLFCESSINYQFFLIQNIKLSGRELIYFSFLNLGKDEIKLFIYLNLKILLNIQTIGSIRLCYFLFSDYVFLNLLPSEFNYTYNKLNLFLLKKNFYQTFFLISFEYFYLYEYFLYFFFKKDINKNFFRFNLLIYFFKKRLKTFMFKASSIRLFDNINKYFLLNSNKNTKTFLNHVTQVGKRYNFFKLKKNKFKIFKLRHFRYNLFKYKNFNLLFKFKTKELRNFYLWNYINLFFTHLNRLKVLNLFFFNLKKMKFFLKKNKFKFRKKRYLFFKEYFYTKSYNKRKLRKVKSIIKKKLFLFTL